MSLKKEIFLTIKNKIDADFKDDVKTFRLFNDQFENEEEENAFPYNAVFLQYENIDYGPTTAGSQQGDILLTLHVGFETMEDDDLRIFDLLDKLFLMMTDLNIGMTRIREVQDISHDNIQVWTQSYKVTQIDDTASIPKRRKTTVTVTGVDVVKDLQIDPNTVGDVRTDDTL